MGASCGMLQKSLLVSRNTLTEYIPISCSSVSKSMKIAIVVGG